MAQATDPVTGRPARPPVDQTKGDDNPQNIADDIRETRAELSETISAIGDKLDPSRLVDEAKETFVSSARDAGSSMIDQVKSSNVLDVIKENPLPAAAVGLSLAWFLSKMGESESDRYRRDRYEATGDPYYAPRYVGDRGYRTGSAYRDVDTYGTDPYGTSAHVSQRTQGSDESILDKAKDAASDAVDSVKDTASDLGDKAQSLAGQAQNAVSGSAGDAQRRADDARRQAMQYGRRAESWMESQLRQNPLAVGAVALAAGALVGLSVPETDAEHQAFGQQADAAKRQLADAAQEAAETVTAKAQNVADEAAEKAKQVGKEAESKVKQVGDKAQTKADRVADQAKADVQKAKPGASTGTASTTSTTSSKGSAGSTTTKGS